MSPVALVTGASRGIGRAIASDLAERGVRVAVHYHRDRAAAEATLALLDGEGHSIFRADLGDAGEAQRLVPQVVERMGALDIVVNNAGIYEMHPILEVGWEQWRQSWEQTLATNLLGPAHVTFEAARHMCAAGGGRLINITSRGAVRGEPDAPAYGAAKAGLNAMSQSMARALGPSGVFVYVVAPGWVETDMAAEHLAGPGGEEVRAQSPLGRVARPREIARTVSFLALDDTEYLTGSIVDVFGASYLRS
jgi:NAD(P)-dependent dehydrogenase (short-subunit alcohol dehydrogenase family)